ANRVVALANQRGIYRFALVGHSWGSAVSLAVAMAAPERVTRVALYNGMFFTDQQPTIFHWARVPGMGELIYGVFYPDRQDEKLSFAFYDPDRYVDEATVEDVERLMDKPGTLAAALASVRAMEFGPLEARYGTVQQPVLLLWGREDNVTPLGYGERLLGRLPNARLVVYPRCGHLPMLEAAGASTQELLRFLKEGAS
ncbi:MAG: alpha/beta hydrolase, partial [Deltaproteobacteria bacterium]|nr:alpha/beta hydrolase [Deltaproteobacteria bacterium]MBW2537715.1 alpha/beta hydrolase [Deltaproteobacteria bacterium]